MVKGARRTGSFRAKRDSRGKKKKAGSQNFGSEAETPGGHVDKFAGKKPVGSRRSTYAKKQSQGTAFRIAVQELMKEGHSRPEAETMAKAKIERAKKEADEKKTRGGWW